MTADRRADVIVVGLGAMGSATALQLAQRGVRVIGVDRYAPPHARGSTHGETRITRLAIGEGAEYAPLALRSHELWRDIEERSGVRIRTRCGGLILGDAGSAFLERTRAVAAQFAVEHERVTHEELAERFPMFAVEERTEAYFEPEAGFLRPAAAVTAQLQLARESGAQLRLGERALRWAASPNGVELHTDAGAHAADRLVLCVGPWIGELLPESAPLFAVHRQLQHWFPIRQGYERLRDMPIFVWDLGGVSRDFVHLLGFYGFPAVDGPAGGIKVATESYESTMDPEGPRLPASESEMAAMHQHYVGPYLPWLGRRPLRTVPCLYTCTRGSRFLIDRHPEHEAVLVVSACSGHGFKHSPAIGEAVAQCLTSGSTDLDLGAFSFAAYVSARARAQ